MKIIHIVPHIVEEASGPSYVVPRLCQSEAREGHDVELTCLANRSGLDGVTLDVHPQWPMLERFAVSPSLARALYRKAADSDVVHNHSLWSMVNVASGWVVPGRGAKLVTSPHGTLSPWALSINRHVKRLLWPLQRRALAKADLLHATSVEEYQQIRAIGFKAPVAVIPNGIDLPDLPGATQSSLQGACNLLFLSRIHPIKCIDRLMQAWAKLQSQHPQWRLIIAGKGDSAYEQELYRLAQSLGLERIEFPGPVYGEAKSRAYFEADLFVLPTHSENFGMVVAEALAHCCPAVVSRGAPWAGLETEGCGWWIDNDAESLTAALDEAMQLSPSQLQAMGLRGRAWMDRDYGWSGIGKKMITAYQWLIEGGDPPAWVRTE